MCREVGKTNKEYNSLYFALLNLILCSELHQPSAYGLFLDCSEVATILKCVSKICLFEQEFEKDNKDDAYEVKCYSTNIEYID